MDISFNDKILVLSYLPRTACPLYRLINPYTRLSNLGVDVKILECTNDMKLKVQEIMDYKYVVMHTGFCTEQLVKQLKALGKIVILDTDDYHVLPEYHILHEYYDSHNSKRIKELLKMVDIVTTTNEFLASQIKELNSNIFIIPNWVQVSEYMYFPPIQEKEYDKVKLAYTGGTCHRQDIELLRGLNRELVKSGIDYEFHLYGKGKSAEFDYYFNVLTDNGKYKNNIVYHDFVDTKEYYKIFNDFNVVLAPLKIDIFNKSKSNLKYIEATYFNCVTATSNISTFDDIIDGWNGIKFSNVKELVDRLKILSTHNVYKLLIKNAYQQIMEKYDIDKIMINYLKFIK